MQRQQPAEWCDERSWLYLALAACSMISACKGKGTGADSERSVPTARQRSIRTTGTRHGELVVPTEEDFEAERNGDLSRI